MKYETYIIKYKIIFTDNSIIDDKEMKVKNCLSNIEAQIKLEDFLKKKYTNFKQLKVHSCNKDVNDIFNDIFNNTSIFNDIFKKNGLNNLFK